MSDYICIVLYMVSCVLFIMGIKKLGKADTARKGNLYSSIGMLIAVVSVLISQDVIDGGLVSYLLIIFAIAGHSVADFGSDFFLHRAYRVQPFRTIVLSCTYV